MWEQGEGRGRMVLRNEMLLRGKRAWPSLLLLVDWWMEGTKGRGAVPVLFPAGPPPLSPGSVPLSALS